MRFLAALLMALVGAICLAQPVDTYGKTNADILAMGKDKWYDFYTSKAGESTAAMAGGYGIYADVAAERNARHMTRTARRLRNLLRELGNSSISIGSNKTGGGTMWIPVGSSMSADVEDVVDAVLGGTHPRRDRITPATLTIRLNTLRKTIEAYHRDKDEAATFHYREALGDLRTIKRDVSRIEAIAKKLDAANSDRVLRFCSDWIQTASDPVPQ